MFLDGYSKYFGYICAVFDYDYIFQSFKKGHLEPFYEELYPGLLVYATRQLGDELAYLAEDCVQDAVMSSYTERHRLENSRAWYAYILKAIYFGAVSLIRRRNSSDNYMRSSAQGGEEVTPAFDTSMMEQEALDMLYSAIDNLDPRSRAILRMSYQEGLKNVEIAARLGVAEITVKKQKAKILLTLRESFGQITHPDLYLIALLLGYYCELKACGDICSL